MLLIYGAAVLIAAVLLSVFANLLWPKASVKSLAAICGCAIPWVLLSLLPLSLLLKWVWPDDHAPSDMEGLILIFVGVGVLQCLFLSICVGVPGALLTLQFLRRRP